MLVCREKIRTQAQKAFACTKIMVPRETFLNIKQIRIIICNFPINAVKLTPASYTLNAKLAAQHISSVRSL